VLVNPDLSYSIIIVAKPGITHGSLQPFTAVFRSIRLVLAATMEKESFEYGSKCRIILGVSGSLKSGPLWLAFLLFQSNSV
jgi:hypothetical protein